MWKHLPWLLVCLAIGGLAFYYWQNGQRYQELLDAKKAELTKVNLDLGRAETLFGDANTQINKLKKSIQNEIKERKGVLSLYAELEAKYEVEKKKQKIVTKIVYQDKQIDLPKGKLYIHTDEGYKEITAMPFRYGDFRIDITGDALKQELSYKLHQKLKVLFVESKLPNGVRNHYAELYELTPDGLQEIKLESFQVIRSEELKPKMMWWNPKLDLMLGAGITSDVQFSWTGDIGISLSAFGRTPNDLSWRFFRFSAGATSTGASLAFSPFQWNLAEHLPLVSNWWLGVYGGYDINMNRGHFGVGTSVVF